MSDKNTFNVNNFLFNFNQKKLKGNEFKNSTMYWRQKGKVLSSVLEEFKEKISIYSRDESDRNIFF